MRRMIKRIAVFAMALAISASSIPFHSFASYESDLTKVMATEPIANMAIAPRAYGIPNEIDDVWEYAKPESPGSMNSPQVRAWMQGNAYQKKSATPSIDTNGVNYKDQYEKLQKDPFLSQVKIAILYLPNCPYSKSNLPNFQQMAQDSGAKVLAADVFQFRTFGLGAYYDAANVGAVSPIVLWVSADGTTIGAESGVHSTAKFKEILEKAGYVYSGGLVQDSTYTQEDQYETEELKLTNKERINAGLLPLSTFDKLEKAADIRAKEIVSTPTHQRPDGTMYPTVFNDSSIGGISYYGGMVGENLAAGPAVSTPYGAHNAWMNSPPHYANIMNPEYVHMSVGYYANTDYSQYKYKDHWIQLFMSGCDIDSISVDTPNISAPKGSPISDLGVTVTLHCSVHGDSTMPLIDEMVEGYNPNQSGEQKVTVKYGDLTTDMIITTGTVDPTELTADMVQLKGADNLVYNGQAQEPNVIVTNATGDYTLLKDYSYSVVYENNVNAGTATVTITGKGNYTGKIVKTFQIAPKDISSIKLEGVNSTYEYTGKPITPTVTLKDGNQQLIQGKDFTVEYKDNIGETEVVYGKPNSVKGTASVIVTGQGNYQGTLIKNFGFTISDLFKYAAQVAFVLKPIDQPDTYTWLVELQKSDPDMFPLRFGQLRDVVNSANTAVGLDNISAYTILPEANERLNGYYRFVREYVDGITTENVIEKPEVTTDVIKGDSVQISGLESSVNKDTSSAQLTVKDAASALTIDPVSFDAVNAVSLEIDLNINGEKKNPEKPVTITMGIPEGFTADDDLVVLHYADGTDSDPEVLNTVVNDDGTFSFVTKSFSPYVITKKLPQPEVEQEAPAANDAESTGVSFGTESDNGPAAPEQVKAFSTTANEMTVTWNAVQTEEDSNWEIKGYQIDYSSNVDMSNAKSVEVTSAEDTQKVISNLSSGTYYVTVSTIAKAPWSDNAVRKSAMVRTEIQGQITELPDAPAAPSNIIANVEKNNQISLSWTAPAASNGWVVESYKVAYADNEAMSGAHVVTLDANTTTALLDNIKAGNYYITVTAVVKYTKDDAPAGVETQKEQTSSVTSASVTAPKLEPTNIEVTSTTDNQMDVSWTAPSLENDKAWTITGYKIVYSTDEAMLEDVKTVEVSANETSKNISDVSKGIYFVNVYAITKSSWGEVVEHKPATTVAVEVKGLELKPTPTVKPTEVPTATPEPTATVEPTEVPTATPVATATPEPTAAPTAAPTSAPVQATAAPTAVPTAAPTAAPTSKPVSKATATPNPTTYTVDELKKLFEEQGGVIDLDVTSRNKVAANAFTLLKDATGSSLRLTGNNYAWVFKSEDITDTSVVKNFFDSSISMTVDKTAQQNIESFVNGDAYVAFKTAYEGTLPGKATLEMKLDAAKFSGKSVNLYYQPEQGEPELVQQVTVDTDGSVKVSLDHCSTYFFTTATADASSSQATSSEAQPTAQPSAQPAASDAQSGSSTVLIVIAVLAVIAAVVLVVFAVRRGRK